MVELRHAVCVDPVKGGAQIGLGKAVRLRLRHVIGLCPRIVHLAHARDDPIQNFLLAGVMFIQSGFGDSQLVCDVVHGGAQISAAGKQPQCGLQDSFLCVSGHDRPPFQ